MTPSPSKPRAGRWAMRSSALLAVLLSACGGGDDKPAAPPSAPPSAPPPVVNTAPKAVAGLAADAGTPSLGAEVVLSGAASSDAEGQALSYAWTLSARPDGSKATLQAGSGPAAQFTPDLAGDYVVRLRATDSAGASGEHELTVKVSNHLPVPVLDKTAMTVLSGGSVSASAGLSYDVDGEALSYAWSLETRPAGSNAAIAHPNGATLSFQPDLPGAYVAVVKVSDGKRSVSARVQIAVRAELAGAVGLQFAPLHARYSKSLDKLVTVSSGPDVLSVVDPFGGVVKSVVLPAPVKALSLSANGKTAAVLHEGVLSVVDLEQARLLHSWSTAGAQTEVFLTDAGIAYLTGQSGGQWVEPPVTVLDTRDGKFMAPSANLGIGYVYGTMRGVWSQRMNKGFLGTTGLSPADITWFTADPASGAPIAMGDSPYHGDYPIGVPFFLSHGEDLLFTGAGTYFRTDTLNYAGRLSLPGQLSWLSQSAGGETLALSAVPGSYPDYAATYPARYQRFSGALLLAAGELPFPLLGGQQSYGIRIFHSAADHHVALVQTGSPTQGAPGLKYHVIYR